MNLDEKIRKLTEDIFDHPELGYEEWHTRTVVCDFLHEVCPELKITDFARTGFLLSLPHAAAKPYRLCFVAELDAVYQPGHFHCDPVTGAAHVCGHYTQVGIALALLVRLLGNRLYEKLKFGVDFVFVPAEEFLDLAHRQELKDRGEIEYFGGKAQAIKEGVFEPYDFCVCTHAMGGDYPEFSTEINADLDGFLFKYFTFKGQAAHAGFAPWLGKNALSMANLFQTALAYLRQQLDDSKLVRFNPVLLDGNFGINIIADRAKIGTDLRTNDVDYMIQVAKQLDQAAQGAATALGGAVEIETQMGYLPFVQDRYLSTFVKKAFAKQDKIKKLYENRPSAAAGDIGDLSFIMPAIQIGYSGFTGRIHGTDFIHTDLTAILTTFPDFLVRVLMEMSDGIEVAHFYRRSFIEYKKTIERFGVEHD